MRDSLSTASLVFLISSSLLITAVFASTITHSIEEGAKQHVSVFNIWQKLSRPIEPNSDFRIFPLNPYFSVDGSGEVRVAATELDREDPNTCKDASEVKPCTVKFSIFSSKLSNIEIVITITDINDNYPSFPQKYKTFSIEENIKKLNYLLDMASDPDIGDNGMSTKGRYYLKEDEDTFTLDDSNKGFLYLGLKGNNPDIDYEKQKQYNLTLTACDGGGRDEKCSSQFITVQVTDKNDNTPNITNVVLHQMLENATIGSHFGKIYAYDLDSGENARLSYEIQDKNVADYFEIDANGIIKSRQSLNAKVQDEFVLNIVVSDNGEPKNKVAVQRTLKIIDVNDHAPTITQIPWIEKASRIEVDENVAVKTRIAVLQVSDGDLGQNANVTCFMTSENDKKSFELEYTNGLYFLNVIKAFDYEILESENVRVTCRDHGKPPKETSETVIVNFKNINEFNPEFQSVESLYISIDEEETEGKDIFTIFANDKDRGENLNFSANSEYFYIYTLPSVWQYDKTVGKGLLRIKKRIDRENLGFHVIDDTLKFEIFVYDSMDSHGTRRTSSATMTVLIKDINDNEPKILPPLKFEIHENRKAGSKALSVPDSSPNIKYVDPDKDNNGAVFFELVSLRAEDTLTKRSLHFNSKDSVFLVTESGEIQSTAKLDREQYDRYALTVMAYNRASPPNPRKNSTAVIYVDIIDENDNNPVWIFPSDEKFTINITASQNVHEEVTRVEAKDLDVGTNITYTLTGSSGFFEVHPYTGKVILVRELTAGRHELTIRADDNGSPNQFNYTKLTINVFQSRSGFGLFKDAQINLTIIIAMIIITALISVGLVFAIICVRRRTQGFIPPSECDKEGCQCQCSLPDMDMHSMMGAEPLYGQLSKTGARPENRYQMTTFNNNLGSGYDMRPVEHMQLQRNEIVINQQDLDGDSADSGRGGSEDDHGGHVTNNRVVHHNYGSGTLPRYVSSPQPLKPPCHCLGIPEEDGSTCECSHSQAPPPLNPQLSSFLPPPVPPHGVEYRTNATLPRLLTTRPQRNPFMDPNGTSTPTMGSKSNGSFSYQASTLSRSPIPEHSSNPYLRQLSGVLENGGSNA